MAKILNGEKLRDKLAPTLKKAIGKTGPKPQLVIIQIGDLNESNIYIEKKKLFAKEIGALVVHKKYPENVKEAKILADIAGYNADPETHGIMVQLPVPPRLSASNIIESIDFKKDVDGLTAKNIKFVFDRNEKAAFMPATTKGILSLLEHYKIKIEGKKVVIVGESVLVGRPTALAFINRKATVTVCHIHTKNLKEETRHAEILIIATGHVHLITADHVCVGQVVVDVGITLAGKKKVVGDVDHKDVEDIVAAITPVPGGVGPMTVFSLFENLVKAFKEQAGR